MSAVVDAVYENGVLRPLTDLGLRERQRVRVLIVSRGQSVEETRGMLGPVSEEDAKFLAEDDDLTWAR
jgi:predicted DNA-binding antitoxin AbrB/MazE fold protein